MQKCDCGSDCTCNVCPGKQSGMMKPEKDAANPPGAGDSRSPTSLMEVDPESVPSK